MKVSPCDNHECTFYWEQEPKSDWGWEITFPAKCVQCHLFKRDEPGDKE